MAAGDFNRSTEIVAGQRSVTDNLHRSATLLPAQRQYSAVLAGHQRMSDQIEFEFDGQYSRRRSKSASPLMTTAPETTSGYLYLQSVESSERKSDLEGKSVSVSVDIGGERTL